MNEGGGRDIFRMIDANLNRAREALRVIEDTQRFLLDAEDSTLLLKELRSDLGKLARELGGGLLGARDTGSDVGTGLTGESEYQRSSLDDLLSANFSRVQEALRSIEEGLKLDGRPELAARIERHRYATYTMQQHARAMLPVSKLESERLMLVFTRSLCTRSHPDIVLQASIGSGVGLIQLREKEGSDLERMAALRASLHTIRELSEDVLIIVNDRADFARALGADGVHLGQDDMSIADARRVLGPLALIGRSTHSIEEVMEEQEADYLGSGAMFPTDTKQIQHLGGVPFGIEASKRSRKPVYAIGGIDVDRAMALADVGVRRIAVSSAICSSDKPGDVAHHLMKVLTPTQ